MCPDMKILIKDTVILHFEDEWKLALEEVRRRLSSLRKTILLTIKKLGVIE